MEIGYARVSTPEQCLDLQIQALQKAGVEKIFEDRMTGSRIDDRPGLQEALGHLRKGDCLTVWKLDRLGRGVKGLVTLIGELEAKGIQFKSLTESISTSSPGGRLFFHILAAMGQMERELIQERTRAGLAAARRQGRIGGRKRKMTIGKVEAARQLLASGILPKDVAQSLGVSIPTLYRWVPASARA